MQNRGVSRTLFVVILLILLLNAVVSTGNAIEDGASLRSAVPAACWIIATGVWITGGRRRARARK
jgi:Flp pilus assembly protein TadG